MNEYDYEEKKEVNLEDLIQQTEQKILNNEYYEDCTVEYRNLIVNVRIKPISQARFINLTRGKTRSNVDADFNSRILKECILNKENNEPFTMKQINEIFTGGLAIAIALKCIEVSGIDLDQQDFDRTRNF